MWKFFSLVWLIIAWGPEATPIRQVVRIPFTDLPPARQKLVVFKTSRAKYSQMFPFSGKRFISKSPDTLVMHANIKQMLTIPIPNFPPVFPPILLLWSVLSAHLLVSGSFWSHMGGTFCSVAVIQYGWFDVSPMDPGILFSDPDGSLCSQQDLEESFPPGLQGCCSGKRFYPHPVSWLEWV